MGRERIDERREANEKRTRDGGERRRRRGVCVCVCSCVYMCVCATFKEEMVGGAWQSGCGGAATLICMVYTGSGHPWAAEGQGSEVMVELGPEREGKQFLC